MTDDLPLGREGEQVSSKDISILVLLTLKSFGQARSFL